MVGCRGAATGRFARPVTRGLHEQPFHAQWRFQRALKPTGIVKQGVTTVKLNASELISRAEARRALQDIPGLEVVRAESAASQGGPSPDFVIDVRGPSVSEETACPGGKAVRRFSCNKQRVSGPGDSPTG